MTIYILQPNRNTGVEAFVVTFMNGTELLEKVRVQKGDSAVFSLDNPTKPSDETYDYTFAGWASADGKESQEAGILDNIQENKTVYAAFSKVHKPVTVTFMNGQEVWDTVTVPYGGTASTSKGDPSKPEDEQYTYSFAGWASSDGQEAEEEGILKNVTSNKTVYAAYSKKEKEDQVLESPFPNTIMKSWDEIIADAEANNTSGYKTGDVKNLRLLDGSFICYEIADMNVDKKADDGETATFTFAAKTIYGVCQWNTTNKTEGGYPQSNYKKYLEETCLTRFPENIKSAMKTVKKLSSSYKSGEIFDYTAKIWPLSNKNTWNGYEKGELSYKQYQLNSHSIRYDTTGAACKAWLSSVERMGIDFDYGYAMYMDVDGYTEHDDCSTEYGALPCFCL